MYIYFNFSGPALDLSDVSDGDDIPIQKLVSSTRPVTGRASYRTESRAYGNFDHNAAIYTSRHGNQLQNTKYNMDPERVRAIDVQIPQVPRYESARNQAQSTRLPDSVRPNIIGTGLALNDKPTTTYLSNQRTTRKAYDLSLEDFHLAWLESGSRHDSLRKIEADNMNDKRKQELMTETVMADQLSKYVLSDPEQDFERNRPFTIQQQPRRNLDRRLHETRDGKDALRDLFGFYFVLDRTLAIYEYRILGKRPNALPLIPRDQYCHLSGYNQGQPYTLFDLYNNAQIKFETRLITSLPENICSKPVVKFTIISIDDLERQTLLLDGIQDVKRREIVYAVKHPKSNEQLEHERYLNDLHQLIYPQIKNRILIVYTGLATFFRKRSKTNDYCEKEDLLAGLHEFKIHLNAGHFSYAWQHIDTNRNGQGDFNEFLALVFGELNEVRFNQVRKAYLRLDPMKSSQTNLDKMKKFLNLYGHPCSVRGTMSDDKIWERFCDTFRYCMNYPQITYSEFLNFYEALSVIIDNDNDFIHLICNTWSV
ncbi:unnamed protein product [Didymodactylos carnosus]|uniref:Calcyphosin-2 n=1 Tax=Didymodactylos carnosus TaxID=1234261 RepID=A0A815P7S9_9BILA|nr:unnamed protein product [Didymodactylos carnosus]CAF4320245.1 unnamed protein product [Didymodactylos carnosus]